MNKFRFLNALYIIDIQEVEDFIVESLNVENLADSDFIIIDEIGKMELLSQKVASDLTNLIFNSKHNIISTIPEKSGHRLIKRIRNQLPSSILKVTRDNRDTMTDDIIQKLDLKN